MSENDNTPLPLYRKNLVKVSIVSPEKAKNINSPHKNTILLYKKDSDPSVYGVMYDAQGARGAEINLSDLNDKRVKPFELNYLDFDAVSNSSSFVSVDGFLEEDQVEWITEQVATKTYVERLQQLSQDVLGSVTSIDRSSISSAARYGAQTIMSGLSYGKENLNVIYNAINPWATYFSSASVKTFNSDFADLNEDKALDKITEEVNKDGFISRPNLLSDLPKELTDRLTPVANDLDKLHRRVIETFNKLPPDQKRALYNDLNIAKGDKVGGDYGAKATPSATESDYAVHFEQLKALMKQRFWYALTGVGATVGLMASAYTLIHQQIANNEEAQEPSEENTNLLNEHVTTTVELAILGITLVGGWVAWSPHRNVLDKATSIKESWNQFYQNVETKLLPYENSLKLNQGNTDESLSENLSEKSAIDFNNLPGFDREIIRGDGHCFFNACLKSLSKQENLPDSLKDIKDVPDLRRRIAKHIEKNSKDFESILLRPDSKRNMGEIISIEKYVDNLKTNKESVGPLHYGGEVELVALQAMLGQPIVVIDQRSTHDARIYIYGESEIEAAKSEAADKKGQQSIFLHRTGHGDSAHYDVYFPQEGLSSSEALNKCRYESEIPVFNRSMNQAFLQICEVAAERLKDISGDQLHNQLYTDNESLSKKDLTNGHYFALAKHLGQDVLVMEGNPVNQCIAYVGGNMDGEQALKRYVIKERDPSASNEPGEKSFPEKFHEPLFIHEDKGKYTLYQLPEGQGFEATPEDLLRLIKGEASIAQAITTLLNQYYTLANKLEINFNDVPGFPQDKFRTEVSYDEKLENMEHKELLSEYEALNLQCINLESTGKVSHEDLNFFENLQGEIKETLKDEKKMEAELDPDSAKQSKIG